MRGVLWLLLLRVGLLCGEKLERARASILHEETELLVVDAAFSELRISNTASLRDDAPRFACCRPWVSYCLLKDMNSALNNKEDKKAKSGRNWLIGIGFILGSLTLLQFAWLMQIGIMGKEEMEKLGLLG